MSVAIRYLWAGTRRCCAAPGTGWRMSRQSINFCGRRGWRRSRCFGLGSRGNGSDYHSRRASWRNTRRTLWLRGSVVTLTYASAHRGRRVGVPRVAANLRLQASDKRYHRATEPRRFLTQPENFHCVRCHPIEDFVGVTNLRNNPRSCRPTELSPRSRP
jgi:hypothetical protein